MKNKLKRLLKSNKFTYHIYTYLGSLFIKILNLFIPTNNKIILFVSYGGKRFDDSPKTIFEYMRSLDKFKNFKFIWAFEKPRDFNIEGAENIKIDTLKYFIIVLRAKYWVTNSSVKRGLNFSKNDTFYLNTWHGTPIKKMGKDLGENYKGFKSIERNDDIDVMLAQSEYEINIFSEAFNIPTEKFLLSGLPRNDELVRATSNDKMKARKNLNICIDKKVILYAPTFREYDKDENLNCFINPPINFQKWKSKLGENYVIMLRAHYEIEKVLLKSNIKDFVLNVSNYNNINELMIASDILISDYSSIFFDYSLLKQPMLCYAYDIKKYQKKRGMYIKLDKEIPGGILETEDEVINSILKLDYKKSVLETERFSKKYISKYGNACEEVVSIIFNS